MVCGDARRRVDLAADSEVVSGSAISRDVWLVRTGILRLQRCSYDGQRQILSLYLPGDIVGYDGRLREDMSVETVTQSGLCRIGKRNECLITKKYPTGCFTRTKMVFHDRSAL
jgi:CRP-like cAMP-binding protein